VRYNKIKGEKIAKCDEDFYEDVLGISKLDLKQKLTYEIGCKKKASIGV
jgi:hypothetical protein